MDKTEKLSFIDPVAVYDEIAVPEAIVDLEVRNDSLIAHKAKAVEQDVGTWYGRTGVQIKSMTINQNDELVTVLTNDAEFRTPKLKQDVTIPSILTGKGMVEPPIAFPHLFNDNVVDFYDKENDLQYMFSTEPKYTSLTGVRMVSKTGVVVTASSQWDGNYPIYRIFNRKVEFVSDGLLGSGPLTVTFDFPADKPAYIKGYIYQNLRADYTTHSYIIEYLPPGSTTWLPLDTKSPGMVLQTVIYPAPILAASIRWRALTYGNAAGIGRLDWLVGSPGVSVMAKPLRFPLNYFNVTEDDDTVYIEPNRVDLVPSTDVDFNLLNYHQLLCVPSNGKRVLLKSTALNVIPWNVIKVDGTQAANELPKIKLKKGRWHYRYLVSLVNAGKFRTYLSIGSTFYPISDVISGITNLNTRAVISNDEGTIEVHEDTDVFLVVEMLGTTGLSQVAPGDPSAMLELWWIDTNFTPVVAPILPNVGLTPAPFKHLEGSFPVGNGSNLFNGSLTEIVQWANVANYLTIMVGTHFRIWRCSISGGSPAIAKVKITKLDRGAYPLPGAHKPLTKTGSNQWEVMTYTLPPGVYSFEYLAERKDSEWFIEEMPKPEHWEFGDVNIRITLPMVSGEDAGQIVTSSSALSVEHSGYYAFTAIPIGNGWISREDTDFEVSVTRVNAPMTTPTSNGQVVSASSQYGDAFAPIYAFKDVATMEGWVSANSQATVSSPHWLAIQLPAEKAVNEYRITNRNTSSATVVPPKSWTLQYSNDGTNWNVAHTVVNDPANGVAAVRHFKLSSTITAKYWRLHITDSWPGVATGSFVGVALFELMESKTASPEWLQIDFNTPQTFNNYTITNRLLADPNAVHSPQDWTIQGKINGGDWVVVHEVTGDTRNEYGLVREYTLPESVIFDSVRLVITKKNPGSGAELANKYACVQQFKLSRIENTLNADWL